MKIWYDCCADYYSSDGGSQEPKIDNEDQDRLDEHQKGSEVFVDVLV